MAIWDNRATQHFAINDYGNQPRPVRRVTVHGEAAVSTDGQRSRTRSRPEATNDARIDEAIATTTMPSAHDMKLQNPRLLHRRDLLKTTAALGATSLLPGLAGAQGGAKKFAGVTLNVSTFSAAIQAAAMAARVRGADRCQGQLRHALVPGLQPTRRPRALHARFGLRRGQRHLHLFEPLDQPWLSHCRSTTTSATR